MEWLKQELGIGVKDYAVYWFRRAHPHQQDGGRAGFVVTNSVSQNRSRGPSLDGLTLEQAVGHPLALEIVRDRVKAEREHNTDPYARKHWWRHGRPVQAMRDALEDLDRYIGAVAQGKRILLCWCDPWWCPSNLTNVFAFEDAYSMGVLCSSIHHEWARAQSSTLEDRFRYHADLRVRNLPVAART